jgi:hypothetical protein
MRKFSVLVIGALMISSPAAADHIFHLDIPYSSRGACEADIASFSSNDRESLLARFPNFFSSDGEVASFLTRAFTCERDEADGQWYITDHRAAVIGSEWFQRRL